MTKRPKEVRYPKAEIAPVWLKCEQCGIGIDRRIDNLNICETCFEHYCQNCNKMVDYLTIKKDISNPEHTWEQCCSECYLKFCKDIVEKDKNFL
jgi:hypothetical protein